MVERKEKKMFQNTTMVAYRSRMLFHLIMFVSLIAAIKLYPWFLEMSAQYLPGNEIGQAVASYAAVYLAAAFLIPEIISWIWNSMSESP